MEAKKALFIDRDGVINKEKSYVYKIGDFEFIDGVKQALAKAKAAGYLLIVVTNQSGIGRGYYTKEAFLILSDWMKAELFKAGAGIDKIYYCPHAPEAGCRCRKPSPGMFEQAHEEFGIDLSESVMVGDKESDMSAAKKAGVGTVVLVRSGHSINEKATVADYVEDDLLAAVKYLG